MLENLYTTKMSNDKKKLRARLENIQREPKRKHTATGLLVFLVLSVALTVGTLCLAAAANQEAAPDVTMTDEEFAAFLDQPWGTAMASLDYADEEILVFHYNEALCVVDLTNQFSFRYIFDLRDLNITTAAQGDVFLQVDVAQDGSTAYLSTGGMTDLAAEYDTYVVDLTTGEMKKGELPDETNLFRDQKDTFAVIPDVAGWSSQCISVDDRTYYLNCGGSMVCELQLVIHYADGSPDLIWYLFGEPPYSPVEEITETSSNPITSNSTIHNSNHFNSSNSNFGSSSNVETNDNSGNVEFEDSENFTPDPSLPESPHLSSLFFKVSDYLTTEFSRVLSPYYDITEMSLTDWTPAGETEGTFRYIITYKTDLPPEDLQPPLLSTEQLSYDMKVTQDEDGLITFYRDISEFGGQESTEPEWAPTDVQSMVSLP